MENELKETSLSAVVEDDIEIGDYYFESDSLAIKGNADYQRLIKAFVQLQAQRIKAVKDLETLQEVREQALNNPFEFVSLLQSGNMDLPLPQKIYEIPEISWEKYNIEEIAYGKRPKTRKWNDADVKKPVSNASNIEKNCNVDNIIKVRGRLYDSTKPQTFNQPWSQEEQRKLEELLIKYPDEPVSFRRWSKISQELGTRTPLQVQSRIQKYFVALKNEGLPVPGKPPSLCLTRCLANVKKRCGGLHRTYSSNSKFMKAFNMSHEDQTSLDFKTEYVNYFEVNTSDEDDIPPALRNTEVYNDIMKLKRIKQLKTDECHTNVIIHYGFSCDGCGTNPINGVRWHCKDCSAIKSIDLCSECYKNKYTNEIHTNLHTLTSVQALPPKRFVFG